MKLKAAIRGQFLLTTKSLNPRAAANGRSGLTEQKRVPREWFPPMQGLDFLALACGGGQQAPIFAAAGANVTVLDNSPRQLDRDREVAEREGLQIKLIEGDMRDLSMLADSSFDFIFHPVSNLFVPEVRPVWKEAFRVLRRGGTMLAGMMNPIFYIFDIDKADQGVLEIAHKLPYADSEHPEIMQKMMEKNWPLEHSHSLDDQIGGQMDAGFHLIGFYEDQASAITSSANTHQHILPRVH